MRNDPCFTCPLPDCDHRHQRCAVRRLHKSYEAKRRAGNAHLATDLEREGHNVLYNIWQMDRKAEASEGGRPFRRGGRDYGMDPPSEVSQ